MNTALKNLAQPGQDDEPISGEFPVIANISSRRRDSDLDLLLQQSEQIRAEQALANQQVLDYMDAVFNKNNAAIAAATKAESPVTTKTQDTQIQDSSKNPDDITRAGTFSGKDIPKNKRAAIAAVILGAGAIASGVFLGNCGKGCGGGHPGHDASPIGSTSSSQDSGAETSFADAAQQADSGKQDSTPSTVIEPTVPPAPTPVPNEPVKKTDKTPGYYAPKPHGTKISEAPKKSDEMKKTADEEPQECTDETKGKALETCLLKMDEAKHLRDVLFEQLGEERRQEAQLFAPVDKRDGPAYAKMDLFKIDRPGITFVDESSAAPKKDEDVDPILETNKANKKMIDEWLETAEKKIWNAKTLKEFEEAEADLKKIIVAIEALTAERAKQTAAAYAAANDITTNVVKGKIADIEKHSKGKKIDLVAEDSKHTEPSENKFAIDVPVMRKLLDGTEEDMNSVPRGTDPDKLIAEALKQRDYNRALIAMDHDLDTIRAGQRTAAERILDYINGSFSSDVSAPSAPVETSKADIKTAPITK